MHHGVNNVLHTSTGVVKLTVSAKHYPLSVTNYFTFINAPHSLTRQASNTLQQVTSIEKTLNRVINPSGVKREAYQFVWNNENQEDDFT